MATQPIVKKSEQETVVPFRPLTMLDEMEHMFENIFPHNWLRPFRSELPIFSEGLPRVDVVDTDDAIIVRAALPGVEKEDLEVSTTPQSVTIRGSMKKEVEEEKGEYYRCEISTGNYLRTVSLPASIDEDKVKAKFKNGMLELNLPKLESAKRHTIKIETD